MKASTLFLLLLLTTFATTAFTEVINRHKTYTIKLIYYDNTDELLIYKQLPHIIATDSNTFCVIDDEHKICGIKQFKIIK